VRPVCGWPRFLLIECVLFHAVCALPLAAATEWMWAVGFIAAAGSAGLLLLHITVLTQLAAWYAVFPVGFAWAGVFAYGTVDAAPTTLGLVVWPALYLPWAVVAVRIALGKR
jgi:hypothetical protein